jgi:hypothetical protein
MEDEDGDGDGDSEWDYHEDLAQFMAAFEHDEFELLPGLGDPASGKIILAPGCSVMPTNFPEHVRAARASELLGSSEGKASIPLGSCAALGCPGTGMFWLLWLLWGALGCSGVLTGQQGFDIISSQVVILFCNYCSVH